MYNSGLFCHRLYQKHWSAMTKKILIAELVITWSTNGLHKRKIQSSLKLSEWMHFCSSWPGNQNWFVSIKLYFEHSIHTCNLSYTCPSGSVWSEWVLPAPGPAEVRSGAEAAGAPRGPSQGLHHQGGASSGLLVGLQLPPEHAVRPQPVQHP